jgi:hypothetical protein
MTPDTAHILLAEDDPAEVELALSAMQAGDPRRRIEVVQAAQYKVDPPVTPGQGVQDVAIQHKHRMHLGALVQGMVQCGIVGGAQIAAKPHQTGLKAGLAQGVCLQH